MPFYGTVLGKQKITLCFASYPSRVGKWGVPQFALPIARRSWQTVCQNIPWPQWNSWILKSWKWEVRRKKPSFICLSRGRISAVSHRASARQTRTFAAVYRGVNLRTPLDIRASLWMRNIPNSKDVEVFSRFMYAPGPKPIVWFNWFKRDSLLLAKNRRAAREKSGWVACCDYIQRGIFSTELACFGVLLYKPK